METVNGNQFVADLKAFCQLRGIDFRPEGHDYIIHHWGNNTSTHHFVFRFAVPITKEKS